jgi:hypothetical protein
LHDQCFIFCGKNITGDIYLDLLGQIVLTQVDDTERENATVVVFQQDSALPHFSLQVYLALNARFPNRWIGRGESIAWPPRNPNLTPLQFFMWRGYVKSIVYAVKFCNLDHLQ